MVVCNKEIDITYAVKAARSAYLALEGFRNNINREIYIRDASAAGSIGMCNEGSVTHGSLHHHRPVLSLRHDADAARSR